MYASADPVNSIDPSGLNSIAKQLGLIQGIGQLAAQSSPAAISLRSPFSTKVRIVLFLVERPVQAKQIIMSLSIRLIGYKNISETLETVTYSNQELSRCGIQTYCYRDNKNDDLILPWMSLSPSDLDYLKFIANNLRKNPKWFPDENFISQRIPSHLKQEIISENKSHLICHMNFCGYYVPIDFGDILLPNEFLTSIGSSVSLFNELKDIASKLKLDLGNYTPDFEILYETRVFELENDLLGFEKMLLLYDL